MRDRYGFKSFVLIGCSMGGRIVSNVNLNNYDIGKIVLWYSAIDYGRGLFNITSKKEKNCKNNRYNHPNTETLNNLNKSKIYRTDIDGSIMFNITNNKVHIETCGP